MRSMAWGGERGVVVLDVWRRCVLAALPAHALYLPHPELRAERAERVERPERVERVERRSPDLDQVSARAPRGAAAADVT